MEGLVVRRAVVVAVMLVVLAAVGAVVLEARVVLAGPVVGPVTSFRTTGWSTTRTV
ncbi:hypothetical protein Acsp05_47110 [Actinokineospora sp. NBRC 105648]|nr:hypothetical protein Acsp05_47110 [Actinokineospora sp. NBRC 105648]